MTAGAAVAATRTMGLIGAHASEAMSPALWRPVLARVRPGWVYEAWDVEPDALASQRGRLLDEGVVAFNVTMPHKRWAASVADTASDAVRRSGAANLLIRDGRALRGHNTDIDAMRRIVADALAGGAVVLGAGGAGRAAIVSVFGRTQEISVADPDASAVADCVAFAARQGIPVRGVAWEDRGALVAAASLAVNATPVGMRAGDPAVWGTDDLASIGLAYDFVYAAHETASARAARQSGVPVVDGWDHLLRQAQAMIPLIGLPAAADDLLAERVTALRSGALRAA